MKTIHIESPQDEGKNTHIGTLEVSDSVYAWLTSLTEKIPMSSFRLYPVQYDQDTMTAYLSPTPVTKEDKEAAEKTIKMNFCQHYFQPVLCNKVEQLRGLRTKTQECVGAICTKCGEFVIREIWR